MSKVGVVGGGYVGLATAVTLTGLGHDVTVAEMNPDRRGALEAGRSPILESGLEELLAEGIAGGLLRFVASAGEAAEDAEFVFLCVQTPMSDDGRADLQFIEAAAAEIGPVLAKGSVVVTRSTVPVGSSRVVERVIRREDVRVVSNPEFLQEGTAVYDSLHPSRVVIGSDDQQSAVRVSALFEPLGAQVIVTDPVSAETIKYAANSFLATKLSFVNALAGLCEAVGANANDVLLGMASDPRVGSEYMRPGPGWGGSCFPKDLSALIATADDAGYEFELLHATARANEAQFERVVAKIARHARPLNGSTIAVWGLTFKAGTNDLRDSPALEICSRLGARGAQVRAYDPTQRGPIEGVEVVDDPYAACEQASVLAVLTEWDEFRWLDFEKVAGLMKAAAIVDARNLLDPAQLRRVGFEYEGIGR